MSWPTARKQVIDEHHTMTDKAVITDINQLTDERVRLNFTTRTYDDTFLNFYKRPNKRILTDLTAIHIDWLDNGDILAKDNFFYRCILLNWLSHLHTQPTFTRRRLQENLFTRFD